MSRLQAPKLGDTATGSTAKNTKYHSANTATLARHTGNVAYTGFTAPKLLWMREEEPENFGRVARKIGRAHV